MLPFDVCVIFMFHASLFLFFATSALTHFAPHLSLGRFLPMAAAKVVQPLGKKTQLLIDALNLKTQSSDRDALIENAKKEMFHDYRSELMSPKSTLVAVLQGAGYNDIATAVMNGDYDDDTDEMDAEEGKEFDAIMKSAPPVDPNSDLSPFEQMFVHALGAIRSKVPSGKSTDTKTK